MFIGPLFVGRGGSLEKLFGELRERGYRVIAPKLRDRVIRLEEVLEFSEVSHLWQCQEGPGLYKAVRGRSGIRRGPDSPKRYLFPPELTLFRARPDLSLEHPTVDSAKIAFFGIRPCDLASIKVMDSVQGSLGDPFYEKFRKGLVTVVENCLEPGETCFCATMGTGPHATVGFDVSYTQLSDEVTLFQPGSDVGVELLEALALEPVQEEGVRLLKKALTRASAKARARFNLTILPEILESRLDIDLYREVAQRCLGCANCNLVCPTCFCFDVIDEPELDGSGKRVRIWDGCLSFSYAQVAGGHFRKSLPARYRHFVLHKFAFWPQQFGSFGCVGCGRCITWCPAAIDLREVLETLSGVEE